MTKTAIGELHEALIEAMEAYRKINNEYADLGRERTRHLNKLNEAQKAFDAAVVGLRDNAPSDSDWKLEKFRKNGVSA